MGDGWQAESGGAGDEEEGGEGGEEAWMGEEGVLSIEYREAFGVDLFTGSEHVGAEAGGVAQAVLSFFFLRNCFLVLHEEEFPDTVS